MAKIEDVVVSDRPWRWHSQPSNTGTVILSQTFHITALHPTGFARYRYAFGATSLRPIEAIAAHAEPEPLPEAPKCAPKCAPSCTPANPCWTEKACRAFNEPTALAMLDVNKAYAASRWRAVRDEPIELRCGRDLACGLFRTP